MEWNYKQIKKRSWDTTFKKGKKSWFMLVVVAFLFAFIGASNGSQTTFIDTKTSNTVLPLQTILESMWGGKEDP